MRENMHAIMKSANQKRGSGRESFGEAFAGSDRARPKNGWTKDATY